jgi:hypothetical protein
VELDFIQETDDREERATYLNGWEQIVFVVEDEETESAGDDTRAP